MPLPPPPPPPLRTRKDEEGGCAQGEQPLGAPGRDSCLHAARCSWERDKGSSLEDRWAGTSDTCVLCLSWPRSYGTLENE